MEGDTEHEPTDEFSTAAHQNLMYAAAISKTKLVAHQASCKAATCPLGQNPFRPV